jgi:F-type H+-transporting ATPase subunit delta
VSSEAIGAIAERYSAALFDLAEQQSALDTVAGDLRTLKGLIAESEDLRRMMRSPVISRRDQQKAVTALAARAGLCPLVTNFLGLVAKNRRLFAIGGMIAAYLARLADRRGEVAAQVRSAVPLAPAQVAAIGDVLKTIVGRNVSLEATVDPALLGGLVVRVGSRMIDGSLGTKLQQLKLAMKGIA